MKVLTEMPEHSTPPTLFKKPEPIWLRLLAIPAIAVLSGLACVVIGAILGAWWGIGQRAFIWAWTFFR